MATYQLWLHGNDLIKTMQCRFKSQALEELINYARDLGYKRLPNGSCVCEVSPDYNERMIKHNRETNIPGCCVTNW